MLKDYPVNGAYCCQAVIDWYYHERVPNPDESRPSQGLVKSNGQPVSLQSKAATHRDFAIHSTYQQVDQGPSAQHQLNTTSSEGPKRKLF
jgi:hypothetical protein